MGSVVKRMDVVAGRKYSARNGEEKVHWINCGEAAEWDDGGITIRLHAVPVGHWFDGTLRLFDRREREREGGQQRQAPRRSREPAGAPAADALEDDIPF